MPSIYAWCMSSAWRTANVVGALVLHLDGVARRATLEGSGLDEAATAALVAVVAEPGLPMGALADALGLSQPGVVRLVDRLADRGLVRRQPSGRVVTVWPEPRGRDLERVVSSARLQALAAQLSALDVGRQQALVEAAEVLLGGVSVDVGDVRRLCRLCDRSACPTCPVWEAAAGRGDA